jgi:hypothetical protein
MTHSFLRPTESEIYALTHRDIAVANDPKRLIITIRKGKKASHSQHDACCGFRLRSHEIAQ